MCNVRETGPALMYYSLHLKASTWSIEYYHERRVLNIKFDMVFEYERN